MTAVDVVIPCYNYARFLPECVASVLAQPVNVRILVIDDASKDDSADVADGLRSQDPRVHTIRHATNRGHIATYNEGIAWATSPYMMILSADDFLQPGALGRASQLMDRHREVGFTFGKVLDIFQDGSVRRADTAANAAVDLALAGRNEALLNSTEFFSLLEASRSVNVIRTPSAIVRTSLQKQLGGYRPELPHAGDLEMWMRFAAHGLVGVHADIQAGYRIHGNNMQNSYYGARFFADLEQRRIAIDDVFASYPEILAPQARFHERLLRPIAVDSLAHANRAFRAGEIELANRFAGLALATDPAVRWSAAFAMLRAQRMIGAGALRRLRPLALRLKRILKR